MTKLDNRIFSIDVLLVTGTQEKADLIVWDADERNIVQIDFKFHDQQISKRADNYFAALQLIRTELEPDGVLLVCYGASLNVYPSPMAFDMGDAEKAYKLEFGKNAELTNLVSIFATGSDVVPATVDEQNAFYERWTNWGDSD